MDTASHLWFGVNISIRMPTWSEGVPNPDVGSGAKVYHPEISVAQLVDSAL
jgi:hypothetical protein